MVVAGTENVRKRKEREEERKHDMCLREEGKRYGALYSKL